MLLVTNAHDYKPRLSATKQRARKEGMVMTSSPTLTVFCAHQKLQEVMKPL